MAPKKIDVPEAIAIVFNVGKSTTANGDSISFFDRAKECLSLILQRKVLSRSLDAISLFLMGTTEPGNSTVVSGIENITCKFDLQVASLEMLRFVETDLKPSGGKSDWVDSLVIALEMLRLTDLQKKRIVLISDFSYQLSHDQLEIVVQNLKKMEVEVDIIGPDHLSAVIVAQYSEPSAKKAKLWEFQGDTERASSELVYKMWQTLESSMQVCTFEQALRHLTLSPVPTVKKTEWKIVIDIGEIEIGVSALVKVKGGYRKKSGQEKLKLEDDDGTPKTAGVMRDLAMHAISTNADTALSEKVMVNSDEVLFGHRYGTSYIPFGESDVEALKYKPGVKCLSVLGFTRINKLDWSWFLGDGCHVIVPREGDENSEVALSALVQALNRQGCAAVARKVYAHDRGLSIVLLSPVLEEFEDESGQVCLKQCLAMNELPYKEDVKNIPFPSLYAELSKEQIDALDSLIDSMDLMAADAILDGEPKEAFEVANGREYNSRFYQHCLIQRALFPDKPLPETVPKRLQDSFELPANILEKSRPLFKKIHALFPMTHVEATAGAARFKRGAGWTLNKGEEENQPLPTPILNFPKPQVSLDDPPEVTDIKLLFAEYCFPPVEALHRVVKMNIVAPESDTLKLMDCLQNCIMEKREFSVKGDSNSYNKWIVELKLTAPDNADILDFLNNIVKAKLGLITVDENKETGVSKEEALEFAESTYDFKGTLNSEMTCGFKGDSKPKTDLSSQQVDEIFENFF